MEGKMNNGSNQKGDFKFWFLTWMGIGQTWGENGDRASGGERDKGRQSGGRGSSGEKEGWLGRGSRAEWREAGAHVGTPLLHPLRVTSHIRIQQEEACCHLHTYVHFSSLSVSYRDPVGT